MTEKDFFKEYDITKYDRPSITCRCYIVYTDNSIKMPKSQCWTVTDIG